MGIPTVSDRIAQGVVKDYVERLVEPLFHSSSFGYRPGRSAHEGLEQCRNNCIAHAWAIDLDISGFFDNMSHEWMMKMVSHHVQDKWVLLYTQRWLKAGIEQEDGSIRAREKGTPQGGVVSPLLSNVYLHHVFDMWMARHYPSTAFERYADDIIVHCDTKVEAEQLLEGIRERLRGFELELHPEKTKLVYCRNYKRKEEHEHNSFTFLGYGFQPRGMVMKGKTNRFMGFTAAISYKSKAFIRERIRTLFNPRITCIALESIASKLNSRIRGWLNYYSRYTPAEARSVFVYLNELIRRWIAEKYRLRSRKQIALKYESLVQHNRDLFVHWQKGIIQ